VKNKKRKYTTTDDALKAHQNLLRGDNRGERHEKAKLNDLLKWKTGGRIRPALGKEIFTALSRYIFIVRVYQSR